MNVLSLRINAVKSEERTAKYNQELLKIEVEDFWSEGGLRNNFVKHE